MHGAPLGPFKATASHGNAQKRLRTMRPRGNLNSQTLDNAIWYPLQSLGLVLVGDKPSHATRGIALGEAHSMHRLLLALASAEEQRTIAARTCKL